MRAAMITTYDGPRHVTVTDVDPPEVTDPDHESKVLLRVRAASIAFPELLQSRGQYQFKPPLPFVPGAEVAGEVISAPAGSEFAAGDRVAALPMLGGLAEKVAVEPSMVFPLPESVSFEAGAAFMFNYGTAYFALVERGGLSRGEHVLVHGAAGGVGTASIQVAKTFGAGRVIAVVSSAARGAIAMDAGADEFVLSSEFKDVVKAAGGVDIVVDPVGNPPESDTRFTDSLRCLREDGRLLVVGFTAGAIPAVAVNRLLLNNISVVGVGWGAYALKRPGHVRAEAEALRPHLETGDLRPVIGSTFALESAADALLTLESRTATGKIVLLP